MNPPSNEGDPCAPEGKAIPTSYKTPVRLLT